MSANQRQSLLGQYCFDNGTKSRQARLIYVLALTNRSRQTNNLWPNRVLANDNRQEAGRRHLMSTNVINELCVHTSLMSCLLTHFTTVSPQPHTVRPHRGTTNNTEVSAQVRDSDGLVNPTFIDPIRYKLSGVLTPDVYTHCRK